MDINSEQIYRLKILALQIVNLPLRFIHRHYWIIVSSRLNPSFYLSLSQLLVSLLPELWYNLFPAIEEADTKLLV